MNHTISNLIPSIRKQKISFHAPASTVLKAIKTYGYQIRLLGIY